MKYVQHSSRILLLFSILTITFVATQEVVLEDQFSTLDKLIHPIVVDKVDRIIWVPGLAHAKLQKIQLENKIKVIEWVQA